MHISVQIKRCGSAVKAKSFKSQWKKKEKIEAATLIQFIGLVFSLWMLPENLLAGGARKDSLCAYTVALCCV